MSDNRTVAIRKEIMMKFLRTIVWIDDEIRPRATDDRGQLFRSLFYPTAQQFQKRGLLVHLHPFDADSAEEDDTFANDNSESFDSALKLARTADIILLDWHLGRNDPDNSIRLLKNLNDESAIRHIVVLSKWADRFVDEMASGKMLATGAPNSSEKGIFKSLGDSWVNECGTHLIVMSKPDLDASTTSAFCDSILENIYTLMATANPDYLHWTAFEIAGKLRRSIPHWIQSIPTGTDAAILSELLSEKTEARDFIPEHLLEDLTNIARLHSLDSIFSDNCDPQHWLPKDYEIEDVGGTNEKYKKFVHFNLPASELDKRAAKSLRKNASEDESCNRFITSQQSFTEFCEKISSFLEDFPTFGSVYIKVPAEETSEESGEINHSENKTVFFCLSQECDSKRSESLMLLEGSVESDPSVREGATKLALLGKIFEFLPEAQSILSVAVVEENGARRLEGFRKIGQLRKATARRILSRFWNHLSRPAVNLSRFTLKDRDGE